MAIPVSDITEDYDAFKILRESQLNTAMNYIDVQFNTYTSTNFTQLALDVFGVGYVYNNDGIATLGTPLVDSSAQIADNETITGSWTFNGTVAIGNTVTSTSTFTSSGQMRAKVYIAGAQSINDATLLSINFDTEVYDVGVMHDNAVNNSRLTVPGGGDGLYEFKGQVEFAANATGKREIFIYKNGSPIAYNKVNVASATETTVLTIATDDQASVNDFYELKVNQTSGGALNANLGSGITAFSCMKVW